MAAHRPLSIVLGLLFAIFSLWIHHQVKVVWADGDTPAQTGDLEVGDTAPDFSAVDLQDRTVQLADYRDRVVVLDFWATWCGPCLIAMPDLQQVHEDFAPHGVEILAINQGEDRDRIARFIQRHAYTFRVVRDEASAIGALFGIRGLPAQLVIGTDGRIEWIHLGYSTEAAQTLRQHLERLTRGKGA